MPSGEPGGGGGPGDLGDELLERSRPGRGRHRIPPKSVTKVPVSCVEQGRWNYRGRNFQPSPHHAAHSIRKMNVMHHKETLKSRQGYRSDQGQVWAHVAHMSHAMDAPTPTGAMHGVYEQKKSSFEEFGKKPINLPPVPADNARVPK